MVARVREQLVTEGLDAVLTRKKRETSPIEPIFDGERQAQLIALACSAPPAGHARWTIRLLAEHVVKRKIVESAHFNTVGEMEIVETLAKTPRRSAARIDTS
jgi:Homeodomain-like domain